MRVWAIAHAVDDFYQGLVPFLYNGTRAMYERCGFDFVRPKGMKNTVMRRTVVPAG